ncbi:MAG: hypothetical protein AB1Z98_21300 [Nannocystaceae bacterium]
MEGGIAIAVVVGIAALGLAVARGAFDGARFRVEVRGEGRQGIRVTGTVPGYAVSDVADFVGGLSLPVGSRIRGIPEGDRLTLRFSDEVPEHLHQRLRNWFYLRR